ncbi:hypothetical protein [Streptomyces sp. NPDC001601]|uniref:hypothetical protein n=1 Tax=unclassified Streptomyces TaxID=2593676 RepID=UPI0036B1A8BC
MVTTRPDLSGQRLSLVVLPNAPAHQIVAAGGIVPTARCNLVGAIGRAALATLSPGSDDSG